MKGYTDEQVYQMYVAADCKARQLARDLSVSHTIIYRAVKRHKNNLNQDPAVKRVMEQVDTGLVPGMIWLKDKNKSVRLDPKRPDPTEIALQIKEIFEDIEPTPVIETPTDCNSELLTLYTIADFHLGLRAWAAEVGEDYDSEIAINYLREGVAEMVNGSPASETAIILNVGDFLHADDNNNATPRSKHVLDVDTRHFKTIDTAIQVTIDCIELALRKHSKVVYRALRGNHDEHSHMYLTFALAQRYRLHENVTIEQTPNDYFVYQFDKVMIASHHGDKSNAKNLVLFISDVFAKTWGDTKHRYLFTGHKHHYQGEDIGGMRWEGLRAATKKDVYAYSHGYCGQSQLQSVTYHKKKGERSRVVVNY
jgi:hypothetical protein